MGRKRLQIRQFVGIGPVGHHLKLWQLRVTASKLGEFLRKIAVSRPVAVVYLKPCPELGNSISSPAEDILRTPAVPGDIRASEKLPSEVLDRLSELGEHFW